MQPKMCKLTFLNIIAALRNQIRLDALAVVRPTMVYLLDFFCSGIQFYLLFPEVMCSQTQNKAQ